MAHVKLLKRDFYFYYHLLHTISVINSKLRNCTTNVLSSVLNSRLLKPIILKFSFIFIEFRYRSNSLAVRVLAVYEKKFFKSFCYNRKKNSNENIEQDKNSQTSLKKLYPIILNK